MNVDTAYAIGSTHTICQDYAYSSMTPKHTYIIVSDGCSASNHSDVGSRILVHQTAALIDDGLSLNHALFQEAIERSRHMINRLSLPTSALDCTLMVAHKSGKEVRVLICGDGVLSYQYEGELPVGYERSYPSNAPGYISYWGDQDRTELYRLQDLGVYERRFGTQDGVFQSDGLSLFSLNLPIKGLKWIALFSDGVSSFQSLSVEEVVSYLTEFPINSGAFVKRRLRRFIRKTCPKSGWHNRDDIAIATLVL